MILYSTDDDRLAFELGQDAAEVTVQFIPERFVTTERSPSFRREDRVHQDFGERLRDDGIMPDEPIDSTHFRVDSSWQR